MTAAVIALLIVVAGMAYTSDTPQDDHTKIHICIGHCANTQPEDDEEPCDE